MRRALGSRAGAILLSVWLALHLDVSSEVYFVLSVIIAVPGGLLSYWAIGKKWPDHSDRKDQDELRGIDEIVTWVNKLEPKERRKFLTKCRSEMERRAGTKEAISSTQYGVEMTPENLPVHTDCTHV